MRVTTALNKRDRIVSRLRDLVWSAKRFSITHDEYLKRREEALGSEGKLPQWVSSYLRGYERAMYEEMTKLHIYGGYLNGVFYSTHHHRDDYYEKRGMGAKDTYEQGTQKGFYWPDLKPWFIPED